jgi:hypothetical protein
MVQIGQLTFSLLNQLTWLEGIAFRPSTFTGSVAPISEGKSVAIIGAGSAGLAALGAFHDLPIEVRAGWDIVLYEQRGGVGGIWLPDTQPVPSPPGLPETPLYPRLRTNTPVPTMTYPGFPFPPGTPLYPSHEYVQRYHADYADKRNLTQYIRFNHTLGSASWSGSPDDGAWDLTLRVGHGQDTSLIRRRVDHLVVASGHNHYPRVPLFEGTSSWLGADSKREIRHSIYYRTPDHYLNHTVLVVGGGASGRDAAQQIVPFASATYQSLKPDDQRGETGGGAIRVPLIARFNTTSVIFADGSALHDVDSVLLATGYELKVPFLSAPLSSALSEQPIYQTPPEDRVNSTTAHVLTTNLRYLFPLHEHIFSLSKAHPPTALMFIGQPIGVSNCPSDRAQALLAAHAVADPSILGTRQELLSVLEERETRLRSHGQDPYQLGHRLTAWPGMAQDYHDRLVDFLRAKGKLPPGPPFTEPWRREVTTIGKIFLMRRAWFRVESLGEAEVRRWVGRARTEEQWAEVMVRLIAWQEEWERENGIEEDEFEFEQSFDGLMDY